MCILLFIAFGESEELHEVMINKYNLKNDFSN